MNDLVTTQPLNPLSFADRRAGRELTKIRQATDLVVARRNAQIDAIESVTEAALLATAHVSALEAHLVGLVPHADNRLRHVADGGAMAMANVVTKLARS